MPTQSRLEGLTAIVTGSSSGIGRAIALALSQEGALVVCADLHEHPPRSAPESESSGDASDTNFAEDRLATHELVCSRQGEGRAIFFPCDVSLERATIDSNEPMDTRTLGMADMIEKASQKAGRLDIMVNCAGVGIFGMPTHETSLEVWSKNMMVNSTGPFLGMKHAIAQFLKQEPDPTGSRGSIVNVSSIGSMVGLRECGAYCASKAAIVGISRSVAVDYADKGIRCNVLCPGYVTTPMLQSALDAEAGFREYLDHWIPMQRLGRPAEVADAVVWLANARESRYVTGVVLPVDGGFTAR